MITSKFWVQINSGRSANVIQAHFRECTGLQLQTEVFEYAEGGLNSYTHKLPVRTKVGNVTLKKGLVQQDDLWNWYYDVVNGIIKPSSVSILVYENKVMAQSNPVLHWTLHDALPIKWVGPNFKSDESAVAVDQLEFICGALTKELGGG